MDLSRLTATEARVAGFVAAGRANGEIAAALDIPRSAVATHLADVYRKLGVRSRMELGLLFDSGNTNDRAMSRSHSSI